MQPHDVALAETLSEARSSAVSRVDSFPPERDTESLVGSQLHHFKVLRPLGIGGMGAVYVALDESLDREVALKVLHSEYGGDAALRERFVREARAQARLHSPNVVQVYYIGQEQSRLFFAMELVEGPPLDKFIEERSKPLAAGEALDAMECIARALREANARGFVHRDIKPSNLLRSPDGTVKLADFGLARPIASDSKITQSGMVIGSPSYMSPEQALGREVDHRSDMYSLGATFFHLLTGRPPYEGPTPIATITKHVTEPLPGPEAFPNVPSRVVKLLQRMLAKKPEERFASYDDLLAAIENARPQKVTYAGLPTRAAAAVVDQMTFFAMIAALGAWSVPLFAAYEVGAVVLRGQTLGEFFFRVQVIHDDGTRLKPWQAFVRHLVSHWFGALIGVQYLLVDGVDGLNGYLRRTLPIGGHGVVGNTPGMMMVGAVAVANALFLAVYVLGFAIAAFDRQRRTLHDRASHAVVVYRF